MATTSDYINALSRDKIALINSVSNITGHSHYNNAKFPAIINTFENELPSTVVDHYLEGPLFCGFSFGVGSGGMVFTTYASPTNLVEDTRALANVSMFRNLASMFRGASTLTNVDVSNWQTSKVTNMAYTFYQCSNLTTLNLNSWRTSQVTCMNDMFYNCKNLTSLDVSKWQTNSLEYATYMFNNCTNLNLISNQVLNLSNLKNGYCMFWSVKSLGGAININNLNLPNAYDVERMFSNIPTITSLNLYYTNIHRAEECRSMFENCQNLTTLTCFNNMNTYNLVSCREMFNNCRNLTGATNVAFKHSNNLLDISYMFQNCIKVPTIYMKNIQFADMVDWVQIYGTFNNCVNLGFANLYGWKCNYIYRISGMFNNCTNLADVDLTGWNLSNLYEAGGMFRYCNNLSTAALNNIANAFSTAITYNVKNMSNMNSYSPLYGTNKQINSATVGSTILAKLTSNGWSV